MLIKGPATKTEYVYQNLRKEILSGALEPDRRLRLGELAQRYQISEMPVREALRMLQRDGLVVIQDHRGATVSKLSWERAAEHVEVRTYLEVYAAQEATGFHTADTIQRLRQILQRMRQTAESGQSGRFSQLNRELHTQLYEPCPNSVLKREIAELWDKVWRARSQSIFEVDKERMLGAATEHEAIVDAVESGEVKKVEAAMQRHREATLATWRRIVAETSTSRGVEDGYPSG